MVKFLFAVTLSTGQRTEVHVPEDWITPTVLMKGEYTPLPEEWFAARVRGGRQFTDIHGWTIAAEHIVLFKRLED